MLAVSRGLSGTRVAGVQTVCSIAHVAPRPTRRPVLEVMLGWMDEVLSVDRAGASKKTTCHGGGVTADLGAGDGRQATSKSRNVIWSQCLVPLQALLGTQCNGVRGTTLDQKDAQAGLSNTLSCDDTSSTTASDDDIVGCVRSCGHDSCAVTRSGKSRVTARSRRSDSSRGLGGPRSPCLELG